MWPSISRITIQELTTETALTVCYVVCLVHVNFELETNVLQFTVHKLRDYQNTDRKSETITMNVYVNTMIFRLCLGFPKTDSLINNQPLSTLKTHSLNFNSPIKCLLTALLSPCFFSLFYSLTVTAALDKLSLKVHWLHNISEKCNGMIKQGLISEMYGTDTNISE